MEKTSYKGFKIGDKAVVNISGSHDGQHIDEGTTFIIEKIIPTNHNINKFKYFFKGLTEKFNDVVYLYPNEMVKIKQ